MAERAASGSGLQEDFLDAFLTEMDKGIKEEGNVGGTAAAAVTDPVFKLANV